MKRKSATREHTSARIDAEARDNTERALQIALHGRERTKVERLCDLFLHFQSAVKKCIAAGQDANNPDRQLCEQNVLKSCEWLSVAILEAIADRKTDAIRAVADFVDSWKDSPAPEDIRRAHILTLAKIQRASGHKMTRKQLAKAIGFSDGADISRLTKTALKCGYQFSKDRTGRPKKPPTRKATRRA